MFTFPEPPSHLLHEPFPGLVELNPTPPKPGSSPSSSSSRFFPLSPPAFQNGILHELLIPPHLVPNIEPQHPIDPSPDNKQTASSAVALAFGTRAGRKRSLRKDRHSKIYTAQGPRDRRMRLSLEVARRFFDLQDMLGFDKASKTIQWLLNHSKSSIKELAAIARPGGRPLSSSSSSPKCASSSNEAKSVAAAGEAIKAPKVKKQVAQLTRKASIDPVLAKESRAMARARARERTSEKKRLRLVTSSAALETIDESGSHDLKSSLDLVAEVDELCSRTEPVGVYECLMIDDGDARTMDSLDYYQNIIGCNDTASFFQEQWDMHFTSDAQFHAKTLPDDYLSI